MQRNQQAVDDCPVNLAQRIEEVASGSPILVAVIGHFNNWPFHDGPPPYYIGKLLSWEDARPILDYRYDNGCGPADAHPVYAWTDHRVIFVHEYDGATSVRWLPRNPEPTCPSFGGSTLR